MDAVTNMAAELNVSKIIEEGDSGDQFNPELTDRPFAWQEMGWLSLSWIQILFQSILYFPDSFYKQKNPL